MLNTLLYDALSRVFDSVKVANEDQTADIAVENMGDFGLRWTMSDDVSHGEQYVVTCPFCEDHKGHLYISYTSYASPVVNGITLPPGPLIAFCHRRKCLKDNAENWKTLDRIIRSGMALVGDGMQTSQTLSDAIVCDGAGVEELYSLEAMKRELPDFTLCTENMSDVVAEYLARRRVSARDMYLFRLGHCPIKTPRTGRPIDRGADMIVFPVIQNGFLKGYQARCPDSQLPEDGIRYYTDPGMHKNQVVLNIDNARMCGMAVVCEGPFDAISVGMPGVATFGYYLSQKQSTILTSGLSAVIFLPDTDVRSDLDTIAQAREHALSFNAMGTLPLGAHVVVLPAKDAGEMTRQDIWSVILQSVPTALQDYILNNVVDRL